jgi:hypothetical protein
MIASAQLDLESLIEVELPPLLDRGTGSTADRKDSIWISGSNFDTELDSVVISDPRSQISDLRLQIAHSNFRFQSTLDQIVLRSEI